MYIFRLINEKPPVRYTYTSTTTLYSHSESRVSKPTFTLSKKTGNNATSSRSNRHLKTQTTMARRTPIMNPTSKRSYTAMISSDLRNAGINNDKIVELIGALCNPDGHVRLSEIVEA